MQVCCFNQCCNKSLEVRVRKSELLFFIPWRGRCQTPCGRWRCRRFYMRPPDRVCTPPTLTAGSLYTAPQLLPASPSPPSPAGLLPVGQKGKHLSLTCFDFCPSLYLRKVGRAFFLSLLCRRDFMRCSCFCPLLHITSFICFTPYRALLTSSSTSFSPSRDNSERQKVQKHMGEMFL